VSVARILVWNLADSQSSLDEIREQLPSTTEGVFWIANEPQERFGLISLGEPLPDLGSLRSLIGKDPEFAEEFDLL
jgi:hypothetical protein